MDLILTIPIALQPFVAPRSTHLLFAIGNTITCEWTGFFFNFCLGGIFMNAALSLYYMLMVTYNKSEAVIQQWLEPTVYIGALGLPTVFGIVGIIYKSFNPNLLLSACELAPYPADCTVLDSVDCIRGGTTAVWTKLAHSALYAILAGTGIYCTLRVFWTVRTKTHTTLQYTSDATEHAHKNARQLQRIRAVGTQAMLYCGAFVNGFWVILLTEIVNFYYLRQLQSSQDDTADLSQESWAFPVTLLAYLFWPLQGFFNCCIFMRPQIIQLRKKFPERSFLWACRRIIFAPKDPANDELHLVTSPSDTQLQHSNPHFRRPESSFIVNSPQTGNKDGISPRLPPQSHPQEQIPPQHGDRPRRSKSHMQRVPPIPMAEQKDDDISLASCCVSEQSFAQEFSTEEDST